MVFRRSSVPYEKSQAVVVKHTLMEPLCKKAHPQKKTKAKQSPKSRIEYITQAQIAKHQSVGT